MNNLSKFGVQELDTNEVKETQGGLDVVSFNVGAIVGGFLFDIIANPTGVSEAFSRRRNRWVQR